VVILNDLVEALVTGLVIAIILIPIVWWFWKKFDRPSDEQIEFEETKAKQKEEAQMWAQIEKEMRDQEKVAKEAASKALAKIDARKRAEAVNSVDVANAWSSLGMSEIEVSKTEVKSVRQESEQSSADLSKVVVKDDVDEQMNVDDLLAASDVTKVRSDAPEIETGKADAEIQFNTVEPDWELIEKIQSIAKGEAPNVEQDIPEAPNLELLEHENKSNNSDEDKIDEPEEEIEETGELKEDKDGKIPPLEVTEYESQGDPFSSVENEWSEENSKTTDEDEWGVPWE
tara:strand:+ start:8304 stop:9161 length:858 start_codon:yes stop_codon:yes gene_type:complete